MSVSYVGGISDIEKLPFMLTRNYRIDDCPVREIARDYPEEPWERENRIKRLEKTIGRKLRTKK